MKMGGFQIPQTQLTFRPLRWALKWLQDPVANPRSSQKWNKMGRDMELIVENMLKAINKNTRSRAATAKKSNIIHCDRTKIWSPKGELWTCYNCKFDMGEEEECFKCHGCEKTYHILCNSDAETLCIRVTGAKTKEPQLSFNQDANL